MIVMKQIIMKLIMILIKVDLNNFYFKIKLKIII